MSSTEKIMKQKHTKITVYIHFICREIIININNHVFNKREK